MKSPVLVFALICVALSVQALSQDRLIKPGDVVEIVVSGQEELSRALVVDVDGRVDYPFLDGLPIDNISLQRFRYIIEAQLSRYMEQRPLVTVRFTESYPIKVTVLGQVTKPGTYAILNTTTFQGAISEAGGFTPGAQLSEVKLLRAEGQKINNHTVNMEKFYMKGDPTSLPALKDRDTIMVPGNPVLTTVKIVGSVKSPGSYEVAFRTSLLDAIFMAGGPADDANLSKVKVISLAGQKERQVKINFDDLSKNIKLVPLIVPGDVVYVPSKKHTWKTLASVLRDMTALATLYLLIDQRR